MPGVINSLGVVGLPLKEATIADRLHALGYRSLVVGKWHQGQRPAYLPKNRGFDAFYGLPYSVDDGIGYRGDGVGAGQARAVGGEDLRQGRAIHPDPLGQPGAGQVRILHRGEKALAKLL